MSKGLIGNIANYERRVYVAETFPVLQPAGRVRNNALAKPTPSETHFRSLANRKGMCGIV